MYYPKNLSKKQIQEVNFQIYEEKQLKKNTIQLDCDFYERYKQTLVNVFKYYANISDFTNYTYISFTGFLKFMKDCDLLDNPSSSNSNKNLIGDNKKPLHNYDSKHITLNQMLLNEKKFTSFHVNNLFSKFSSEFPHQTNECKNKFNKKIECFKNLE